MKLNRNLISLLLVICMTFTCAAPVSAATLDANYGEASYYDIAVTNYSRMLLFQNGVVVAANANKQYGLINASGKTVVPFQYAGMWYLGGDLYKVSDSGDNWEGNQGIINSKGKVILPMDDQSIHAQNGIISVMDNETYTRKYYTTEWKEVSYDYAYNSGSNSPIPGYDYAYESDGYYIARKGDLIAALDSNGKVIIPLQKYWIYTVSDGNTVAFVVGNSLLDSTGKTIVAEDTYEYLDADWRGTILVSSSGKRGLMDLKGNFLVPLGNYKNIGGVNMQGYVSAVAFDYDANYNKTNIKSYIFKDGKKVKTISGKFVASETYYRDFAFSTTGELNGMMTVDGKVTLPEKYYTIDTDYNGNLLTATMDKSWNSTYGLYTQSGKQIFAEKYSQISYLKDNKYRMCDGTYYGVMNLSGAEIIPLRNLDMRIYTYSFIELYDGTYHSVVDLSNKTVVPKSTEQIQLFKSVAGLDYALVRSMYLSDSEDNYTKSVMPFCIKTTNGSYATIYADYNTGKVVNDIAVRASNINSQGQFVYQAANGRFGLATLKKQPFTGLITQADGTQYYVKDDVRQEITGIVTHTNGKQYYVQDGIRQYTTGIVKHTNGKQYYVKNGVRQNTTGIVKHTNGKWYHVANGVRQYTNGLVEHTNGLLYYVQNGVLTKITNFIKHTDGKQYYVQKGIVEKFSGLVKHTNGKWYYVENGVRTKTDGLVKHTNGKLHYVENGVLTKITDFIKHTDGKQYYVKDGVVEKITAIVSHTNGRQYYVKDGVRMKTTGLAKHTNNKWYYVENGIRQTTTGLVLHTNGKLHYVKSGVLDRTFNGKWKHTDGRTYTVVNGVVN